MPACSLFLTAGIRAAGTEAIAPAMVTLVSLAIAAGGLAGGLLLANRGQMTASLTSQESHIAAELGCEFTPDNAACR